ncbi:MULTISPECIES: DUF4375 domain-containing protein [Pseudoxanthomonas]|uniref:DNA mimic protein DMP19 C-terminal domain-containing protein n=1 Tax=Pseudoxanthomonas winnipegensis TaxID=2480810 RepID=A0AAW8G9P4_9GAMM|nr:MULTISPECIES: DUF4375 domain-containing protein [Pseudoxanthomonas]MDQ1118677.1 hypothetical protein [Pseudoxanthomonas winnipegensis]MDQ1131862.1 hypothetical protein [Pseudoxanthomonas winnipegensis]MDR6138119.1 hypothetical protein [Pseudoxanthomonas sp. SORGH_AS_0997]
MKVPCNACGALILETTAARNGGVCMPCKTGRRASIEASKASHQRERELDATDPSRIYWRSLVARIHSDDGGIERLSDVEKQYWAVGCLAEEVHNGGFDQFFFNSSGESYEWAVAGLDSMDATHSLELLKKAKQILFGFGRVPVATGIRRQRAVQVRPEDKRLNALDERFCADQDRLSDRCQAFALHHGLFQSEGS